MNNLDTIRQKVNYEMPEGRSSGHKKVEQSIDNIRNTVSVWKENSDAINDFKQNGAKSIIVDINTDSNLEGAFDQHVLNVFNSQPVGEYPDSWQGDRVTRLFVL